MICVFYSVPICKLWQMAKLTNFGKDFVSNCHRSWALLEIGTNLHNLALADCQKRWQFADWGHSYVVQRYTQVKCFAAPYLPDSIQNNRNWQVRSRSLPLDYSVARPKNDLVHVVPKYSSCVLTFESVKNWN